MAAGLAIAALFTISKVWAILAIGGLLVVAASLATRAFKEYWIAVFLATIPFNITKLLLYTPDEVAALKRQLKIVVNENLVPQLYVSDLPFLVLLAIWLGEILVRRTRVRVPREICLLIGFVAWCLLTLRSAPAPVIGVVWAFFELKTMLVLLWLVNASLTRASLRLVVVTLVATLTLQSAMTFVNYRWQLGPDFIHGLVSITKTRLETRQGPERGTGADYVYETGELLRGTGSVGPGNAQAKYIVSVLPLVLASALVVPAGLTRAILLGCFGLALGGLYLTYSRGGLLTAMVGIGIFLLLRFLGGHMRRKAFVTLVAAGMVAAGAAAPYLWKHLTTRPGFYQIRLDHIRQGLAIAADSPLTGVGVNNFNVAVRDKDPEGIFDTAPIHNHYLRLVIEVGVIGVGLLFWFLIAVLRQGCRLISTPDPFLATVSMALVAAVLSILVYWMDDIFYDVIVRTQFAILLGLILVIRQIVANEERESGAHVRPHGGVSGNPLAPVGGSFVRKG